MQPSLQEVDSIVANTVDQAVLGRDSPRPESGSKVLQLLWLAGAGVRIPKDGLDQRKRSEGGLPIVLDPIPHIFEAVAGEKRLPLG